MTDIPNTVFGLMALIIVTLAGVIVRLYLQNSNLYKQINEIQNQRIAESKETRDKVAVPLQQIAQYSELTYNKIIGGGK